MLTMDQTVCLGSLTVTKFRKTKIQGNRQIELQAVITGRKESNNGPGWTWCSWHTFLSISL